MSKENVSPTMHPEHLKLLGSKIFTHASAQSISDDLDKMFIEFITSENVEDGMERSSMLMTYNGLKKLLHCLQTCTDPDYITHVPVMLI